MNIMLMTIGNKIRNRRVELMISQIELSNLCGVSQSHISSIESGTKSASSKTYTKIANAMGVSKDYILTGDMVNLYVPSEETINSINKYNSTHKSISTMNDIILLMHREFLNSLKCKYGIENDEPKSINNDDPTTRGKEIHLYLKNNYPMDIRILSTLYSTNVAINEDINIIHTTQTNACSTSNLLKGYRIFAHMLDDEIVEIKLGIHEASGKEIRVAHNIEKLLLANRFGYAKL